MKELKIKCENDSLGNFARFNEIMDKRYSPIPDILIKDKKIVIEINGDRWHANPKMYKPNDLIGIWGGPTKAKDIWKKDDNRQKHIESFGYNVCNIWEYDIKHNFTTVKEKLKCLLLK